MEANGNSRSKAEELSTWVHKFKHMGCQLHFEVLSWQEDWSIRCCPECGGTEGFLQWSQPLEGFIFQYVPGPTPMRGITNGVDPIVAMGGTIDG